MQSGSGCLGEQGVQRHSEKSHFYHLILVISRTNQNYVTYKVFCLFRGHSDKTQKMAEAKISQLSLEQSFSNPEPFVTVGNVSSESVLLQCRVED